MNILKKLLAALSIAGMILSVAMVGVGLGSLSLGFKADWVNTLIAIALRILIAQGIVHLAVIFWSYGTSRYIDGLSRYWRDVPRLFVLFSVGAILIAIFIEAAMPSLSHVADIHEQSTEHLDIAKRLFLLAGICSIVCSQALYFLRAAANNSLKADGPDGPRL